MAIKKPLVITAGQVERLQPGDKLDLADTVTKQNNTGDTLIVLTPVYVTGNNAVSAQADAQPTTRVAGFVAEESLDSTPVEIQISGLLTAITATWDLVTDETGGLTAGAQYYLSADNLGEITANAPTVFGDFVAPVGFALSETEFEIGIGAPIKL
jgi:hypothetical protein